jgi:hypothetical protein
MNTIKFSKTFGQVEILDQDAIMTTVKIIKTGEVKKLMNKFANLSDVAFEKVAVKKAVVRELTQEELNHLDYLKATGQTLENTFRKSTQNYRNGKSGLTSLTK